MSFLTEYGTQVLDWKIPSCEKIKREYEKLLNDIEHPGRWHFDEQRALRPVQFIEKFCKQSQGTIGEPIRLMPFQKAMLEAAYGFVDDEENRRFQEILMVVGRKNGKTTLLSCINLFMLMADGEGAPECYTIATAKDQAKKGFNECLNMARQSRVLSKHLKKRQSDIYCPQNFGFIKALASNTDSLDGLNGHCIVIDELHAIKNRDIYDLMKQSMSARRQPMLWCITTNGFVRDSIFDSQYQYASGVIDGSVVDDRFLPIIYELDSRAEWTKPDMWVKANPGLGTIKDADKLRGNVEKAKADDTFLPTVLVKDFNLKENASSAWLSWDELECKERIPDDAVFKYGIGGMDAADSVDLNAARMICKRPDDPKLYTYSMYWIPERKLEMAKDRRMPDDVPYDIWAARGLLRIVPGNRVDKQVFLDWFVEMRDKKDIYPLYIGYDPWHIDESLLNKFQSEFGRGVMIPVRQGVATLSQPMKDMKAEFQAHNIIYDDNPIDKWCLANTYVKTDINGNIQPHKGNSAIKRIDGTAALLDAYVIFRDKQEEYESLI